MEPNLILLSDSYKVSHWPQYPPGTTGVYSYFESRGGRFQETVFFGLQYFLKEYLCRPIKEWDIVEANALLKKHFGGDVFARENWRHVVDKHDGYLPLKIKAVPEGMVVPVSNVLMTVENTCPHCYWLTNYVETLLVEVWYPTTVATLSRAVKNRCKFWLTETGSPLSGLDFMLHDFGFRGVSSPESAGLGGLAHLVNFQGTDTMNALRFALEYYSEGCAGFSVPAAEHSTITSWGRDREVDAYRNMLQKYPTGIVSVVSDSWDIYNACHLWGTELKDEVLKREGKVVIRPDSGYPPTVVVKCLNILGQHFGYTHTEKGYRTLPPQIGLIQGDGLDDDMIDKVLATMHLEGWAASNIVFGMGGGLLQKLDRDTQKMAFKCSAQQTNGGPWNEVYKDPVTDKGKKSKRGRLKLLYDLDGTIYTCPESMPGHDLLQTVYENGRLLRRQSLANVRSYATV